jgi:para-aminobenzoate synthetase/4-amino-4-deoxychorismate lyase
VLAAHRLEDVRAVLHAVQAAAQQGAWCVGYLRYEAAPAFDAAFTVHPAEGPLAWFGVHDQALPWPQSTQEAYRRKCNGRTCCRARRLTPRWPSCNALLPTASTTRPTSPRR